MWVKSMERFAEVNPRRSRFFSSFRCWGRTSGTVSSKWYELESRTTLTKSVRFRRGSHGSADSDYAGSGSGKCETSRRISGSFRLVSKSVAIRLVADVLPAGEFFKIQWLISNARLPFSATEHVVNPWNQGSLVKRSVVSVSSSP
jgi:hypothetical protein